MKATEYIAGDRRGRAAHDIELEAMRDPFVAEALEGLEAVDGDHTATVEQLQKRIGKRAGRKRSNRWLRSAAAAALVAIIATTALLVLHQPVVPTADYPAVAVATTPPQDSANSIAAVVLPENSSNKQEPATAHTTQKTPTNQTDKTSTASTIREAGQQTQAQASIEHEPDWEPGSDPEATGEWKPTDINEVVVTAFGTMKKESFTGAVGDNNRQLEEELSQWPGGGLTPPTPQIGEQPGKIESDMPFACAETMPSFQGGDLSAFREWVDKRVRKPEIALTNGIQGRVILSFVIDTLGNLGDIRVLQSPDRSFTEEAIRVLKNSPRWEPGRRGDRKAPVKFTMPVDFSRQN